ncbi:hypothetical protein [Leyella stercorea]|uniref:hypothetical protein n=1 Tax=Leyella stercorea TaxID=363265 RepID=UPI003AB56D8F
MLVTTDADAFLTTSTFHHLNIKSHHLNISTPHHLNIKSHHLTTSPSINNNGKVDIPSTLPLSLK